MKNLIWNDKMWTQWRENSFLRFKVMDRDGREKLPRIHSSVVRHLLAYNLRQSRESDDLVAMGTIWSPNTQIQKSSGSNSANGLQNVTGKSVSMVATSNSSTTVTRKSVKPIMVQNAPSYARSNFKEVEPRYTDPVIGAPPSFQQRLMELSALESETIRYEKSKKVKKKVRDRDS